MSDLADESPVTQATSDKGSSDKGSTPGDDSTWADDINQQAQTGISSPDAEQRAGSEAPASEGQLRD